MKARTVLDDAIRVLKASPAIDHWQRGRERIEAEDLLWHVLGEEPDPGTTSPSSSDARSIGWSPVAPPVSPSRSSRAPRSSAAWSCSCAGRLRAAGCLGVPGRTGDPAFARPGPAGPSRLATGAGTIALAVANEVRDADVIGTDLSADAVRLARTNAKRLGVRARFFTGDLFGGLPRTLEGTVDVVTLIRRTYRCTSSWICPRRSGGGSRSTP